ncbi:33282_t:CDS:1, partial [Racocetra persica]
MRHLILIAITSVVLILFLTGYYISSLFEKYSFLSTNNDLLDKNIIPPSKFLEKEKQRQRFPKFDAFYDDYIKKHNRTVAKLLEQTTKDNSTKLPKVIVVQPNMNAGLGNRLPVLICGFLYSMMITDRLFFIEGFYSFTEYFEKDFDHDWKSVANLYNSSSSKYLHNDNDNEFQLITRGNLSNEEINSYDILYVRTWDYVCAPVISNPNYKEWISSIIPDNKIFGTISQKLLKLQPDLNKQVATFIDNNFGEYNIGIHLKVRKNRFMTNFTTPTEHYCQTTKMLMTGIDKKNVTIFIAADD